MNDLAGSENLAIASITISGTGYQIAGNAIDLAGPIDVSNGSGLNTLSLPIHLTGAGTVEVDASGSTLVVGGEISGTNGLVKQGDGQLFLLSGNSYTGTTQVTGGSVAANGSQAASPFVLSASTTLQGTGTVGAVTSTGATVSPGVNGPGILSSAGSLAFDAESKLNVDLAGTTAGTGYDQLSVSGQVNLGGAQLVPTLGYAPGVSDQLLILNNLGASAIQGTFSGLPEGSPVVIGGTSFRISYTGGDGNDVVLTALESSATSLSVVPTSSVYGQSVTLTAEVSAGNGSGTPGGSVDFFSGDTLVGTATISGGSAILNTTLLPVGNDAVTARYKGDSQFGPSTSAPTSVTVTQASTTTTLNVNPTTSVKGQSVTLTTTVTAVAPGGGSPTGSVEYFNGGTSLGTAPIIDGTSTFTTTALIVGNNTITAVYQGSDGYATSTASAVIATVNQATTTTTLTTSPNPSSVGQETTLTATIAAVSPGSGNATGTVEFYNGATLLGTATLTAGVATFNTSALPLGTSTLTAKYLGDTNYLASESSAVNQSVNPATSTTLTSSTGTANFGEKVTLTASVSAVVGGTGTPSGDVIFKSGSTTIGTAALINGVATLETTSIPGGTNAITAQYQGDPTFGGSTSNPVTVIVGKAETTSVLSISPQNSGEGNLVTITMTISTEASGAIKPTGKVEFFNNGNLIGSSNATNGVATFSTSSLPLGDNSITAVYEGDTNFNGSSAPAVTATVNQASTTTLTASPTDSVAGQAVVLTAKVTATNTTGTPTGEVEFFRGSTSLGKATLNADGIATLTTTTLAVGSNVVTATYQGDADFGSSNSTSVTLSIAKAKTTTALTVVPTDSGFSQEVTLTAVVSPVSPGAGTPTGFIVFLNGDTQIGDPVALVNGVATLTTTSLPRGTNTITARYSSDTNFITSTSNAVSTTVDSSNSVVTVSSSNPNPVAYEAITLTATVNAAGTGTGLPTGTVQFYTNGLLLGTATLSNGRASLITTVAIGANAITVVYSGDSNFTTATSELLSLVSGTQVEQFLNAVFQNATGRDGSPYEIDSYRTQLLLGIPRQRVVNRIVNSVDAQANAVNTVYRTFLRREPTFTEQLAGLSQVRKTQGFAVEIEVLGSNEYFQTQGGGTNAGFVTVLYEDVLGTSVSDAALNRLTRQLQRGTSRTSMARSLVLSTPGKTSFVHFLYQSFYGRGPTRREASSAVGILNRGGQVSEVIGSILGSNTFYNQFGGES